MLNDLKRSREETIRLVSQIQAGVVLLGEEIYRGQDTEASRKFLEYKAYDHELSETGLYDGNHQKNANSSSQSPSISNSKRQTFQISASSPSIFEATDLARNRGNSSKLGYDKKQANDSNINSLGSSMDTQSTGETAATDMIQSGSSVAYGELNEGYSKALSETQIEFVVISNENTDKTATNNELHVINEEEEISNASSSYHKPQKYN